MGKLEPWIHCRQLFNVTALVPGKQGLQLELLISNTSAIMLPLCQLQAQL